MLGAKDFFGRQCGEGNVAKSFDHGTLHFILTPLLQQKRARKEKCSPNQGKGKVDNIIIVKNAEKQIALPGEQTMHHFFQIQNMTQVPNPIQDHQQTDNENIHAEFD